MKWESFSAEDTESIGAEFAKTLTPGRVITLDGELGAGKTAFARGVLRGLGYTGRVTSPTFAIANEYDTETVSVVHFDMYRILDAEALAELGFEEYMDGQRILLIEWSQNIKEALPSRYDAVSIVYGTKTDSRVITIEEVQNENFKL